MEISITSAPSLRYRQAAALALPILLILSMLWVFQSFHQWFGYPLGYLLGFGVYWVGWCLLIPALILGGPKAIMQLFQPFPPLRSLGWKTHLLLWTPVLFPLFARFLPQIGQINMPVLLASILLGIVIGITEEIFWRGILIRLFPTGKLWPTIYMSLLFGLWHICPQSIFPNRAPGGAISFVVYAVVLGVLYALASYRTKSIAWSTLAHVIHDTLGIGGLAYAIWLMPG